ncbi:MAG: hypothetical protein FWG61_08455 [Firmicutes bacterium]|nr:hypothetical protein [Bacillota bacterium]
MNSEVFTREELVEFFRALLENMNNECGKVGYALEAMDVEYEGALSRGEENPLLLADKDGVCIKLSFRPAIMMKEGEAVG